MSEYTTTAACGGGRGNARRQAAFSGVSQPVATMGPAAASHVPTLVAPGDWSDDMADGCATTMNMAFYLKEAAEDSDINLVIERLEKTGLTYHRYAHDEFLGTIFIFVQKIPRSLMGKISGMPGIGNYMPYWDIRVNGVPSIRDGGARSGSARNNMTEVDKRAIDKLSIDEAMVWHRSHVSADPQAEWEVEGKFINWDIGYVYHYHHDGILAENQYIYNMDDGIEVRDDLVGSNIAYFYPEFSINNIRPEKINPGHGTNAALFSVGQSLGLVPRATFLTTNPDANMTLFAAGSGGDNVFLIRLLAIIKDVEDHDREGKCVVNFSISVPVRSRWEYQKEWFREYLRLLHYLERELECVLVAAAGNTVSGENIYADHTVPAMWHFSEDLPNMIVVGASSAHGLRALLSVPWSDGTDDGMVYAPGLGLYHGQGLDKRLLQGTSYAAPMVSSVVAYLRALSSPFAVDLGNPVFAVKMVKYLSRRVHAIDESVIDYTKEQRDGHRRIIWNGNVGVENCLVGYGGEFESAEARAVCGAVNEGLPEPGDTDNWEPDYGVTEDL